MNELIFLAHTCFILVSLLIALRYGKESLSTCVALLLVLGNLFVLKQIGLFGLSATCGDSFAIGGTFGVQLLQEFYGKSMARKAIGISFGALVFFGAMAWFQLLYIPSIFDGQHLHFVSILGTAPRIIGASLTAYVTGQLFNTYAFEFLNTAFQGRYFVLRSMTVMVLAQTLDTLIFSFLGLYGLVHSITSIVIISLAVKSLAGMCSVPFIVCVRRFARRGDEVTDV
jgi:hypothetical protein